MQQSNKIKAMVAGHICLDITPGFNANLKGSFDEIFAPGKLINVENVVIGTGGAVSNTGLAMSKLGIDVQLNGKIGDDQFGQIIKDVVGKDRSKAFSTVSGQSSSYSVVLALPGIDRIFLHHPGTNDTFVADDIDYEMLKKCSLFHFGYPTLMKKMYEDGGQQLLQIFKRAKEFDVVTSLDMTLPDPNSQSGKADWNTILEKVLPYVDIFLPSVEEIAYILDRNLFEKRKTEAESSDPVLCYTGEDCSSLSDKLLQLGVKIVAIKVGIKGYYLRTASSEALKSLTPIACNLDSWSEREIWAGSYKAEKFGSATGAGDTTIAGFLTAFLRGLGPVDSVKTANLLGWQNVREVDTLSGIENWENTLKMLHDKNKPSNQIVIGSQGWEYSEPDKVFYGPSDIKNQKI